MRGAVALGNPNLSVRSVSGFMSASTDGLTHAYKSLWNNRGLYAGDIEMAPLPWNERVFSSTRLKISTLMWIFD